MQGRKIVISIALLSLVAFGGFAWRLARENHRVMHLTVATGNKTGEAYRFAQAMQQVIARHQPQIQLNIIETNGSLENMQLLEKRKVELAIVQSDTPAPASARAISLLYPELFHLVVSEKSAIQSVPDLKGKRIALMPKGSGSFDAFWLLAKHYNLKPNDLQYVALTPEKALLAFKKGEVDAVFRSLPVGNRWTRELIQTIPGRMVPIDQAAAIRISLPYLEEGRIPKGTYKADPPVPSQNMPVVGVKAALITRQDIEPKIIRSLTTIIYEYRHDLVKLEPKAATISQPGVGQSLGLPLHPGAQAYYDREKPDFLTSNADVLALLISIGSLVASWIFSWRSRLLAKQKNRFDKYNLEILDILEQARNTCNLEQLEQLRQNLFEIFRKVVEDLDNDRITQESFQSFTFAWEVAINTIRHRETMVLNLQAFPGIPDRVSFPGLTRESGLEGSPSPDR